MSTEIEELKEQIVKLKEVLVDARDHLDFCGYGNSYERTCAGTLPTRIEEALSCP